MSLTFTAVERPDWLKVLRADPCSYCGSDSQHVDHIVPRARGGEVSETNETGACGFCNGSKSARSLLAFLSGLDVGAPARVKTRSDPAVSTTTQPSLPLSRRDQWLKRRAVEQDNLAAIAWEALYRDKRARTRHEPLPKQSLVAWAKEHGHWPPSST